MIATVRPPTVPTPVTTPSAGVSGSWLRAKRKSSWNSVPGSSRSLSRSRTKSLPSSLSLSRYLTCPCSIRLRSCRYRCSLMAPLGVRVRPENDDEHAVALGRDAPPRRRTWGGEDRRFHLGLLTPQQPHAHAHGRSVQLVRRDLEPALAGYREALLGTERTFHPLAIEGRVVGVAEEGVQARQDLAEPLVGLGLGLGCRDGLLPGLSLTGRRRLKDAHTEPDDLLSVGRKGPREGEPETENHREHRPEQPLEPFARVMQPGHYSSDRAVQHLGDLAVRETFDVTQHDNRSCLGRQGIERPPDALPLLRPSGFLLRPAAGCAPAAPPERLADPVRRPGPAWCGPPLPRSPARDRRHGPARLAGDD